MESLVKDLTCPITFELFEDPISVPCCGKAFSRLPLQQHFDSSGYKCPLCNGNLENFDPIIAKKNIVLAGMVDSVKLSSGIIEDDNSQKKQQWNANLTPVITQNGKKLPYAQLELKLENSEFVTRPTLFIIVVDRSGSMTGSPWKQVETALIHIMSMAHSNNSIKTIIIGYSSTAEIINTDGSLNEITSIIKTMFNGGGTNFRAAFDKIKLVLSKYICSNDEKLLTKENNIGGATIAFLTDGKAFGSKEDLVYEFKDMIKENWFDKWDGPLNIHSIGFGGSCDKDFLEGLWQVGSSDSSFRYAEPQDDGDTLCFKLQSIFDLVSKSCTIGLDLELNQLTFKQGPKFVKSIKTQFPVNKYKEGKCKYWISYEHNLNIGGLFINSHLDKNLELSLTLNNESSSCLDDLVSVIIDDISSELLELSKSKEELSTDIFVLHCALVQKKISKMIKYTNNDDNLTRLDFIGSQVDLLREGLEINIGKVSDSRFASKFGTMPIADKPKNTIQNVPKQKVIKNKPEYKERYVKYNRNNTGTNRNFIQEFITTYKSNKITYKVQDILDNLTIEDILYTDNNSNNTIHLASYCGQNLMLDSILDKFKDINLNVTNEDNETPITLAIKKGGFWKVIKSLLKHGAEIPSDRVKGLEEYAINNDYVVTGKILGGISESGKTVNKDMATEYIEFLYETSVDKGIDINVYSYLETCLSKCMYNLSKKLIKDHEGDPTIDMLLNYCIPPKPDHPEVDKYLDLTKLLVNHKPELINSDNEFGENPLFKACEKGNLPHVKYFINKGSIIDKTNNLGNTPLWISCAKHYPCIIEELLENGADVNYSNLKGNPPLYPLCQSGPLKIVETLLSAGATVNSINNNGDTLILICCRNGQYEKLELLLNYVEPEFVDFKAHIDGFNAILASTEANRPECIKVLYEYGVNLNQYTNDDNPILPRATPLHLAAYYGRSKAAKTLIELGADINCLDLEDRTPLHMAVIQGEIETVKLLRDVDSNLNIKDKSGNTPISYCRNREDIKKILFDPVLKPLLKLSKGWFTKSDERFACDMLLSKGFIYGFLSPSDIINIVGPDGNTPLVTAITHFNIFVVKTILRIKSLQREKIDVHCYVWAKWLKNPIINTLLNQFNPDNTTLTLINNSINKLENAAKISFNDRQILNLVTPPKSQIEILSSGINSRMNDFIDNICENNTTEDYLEEELLNNNNKTNKYSLMNILNSSNDSTNDISCIIWYSKVFTIDQIAFRQTNLTPQEIFAINVYTSNSYIPKIINQKLINKNKVTDYMKYFYNTLSKLDSYKGEVFIGIENIDRHKFNIGKELSWETFLSGSTMWKVAIDHLNDFTTKKKKGVVFIVKSKTGKFVGNLSSFSYDCEVIFKPNTKFTVTNLYRGDVICLGQANIREHTFKIKDEEIDKMLNSDKSLIVELSEC